MKLLIYLVSALILLITAFSCVCTYPITDYNPEGDWTKYNREYVEKRAFDTLGE